MSDFFFRDSLADLDPEVARLDEIESERQYRRLILIASESSSPRAVREALASSFHNIYAEGYPPEETRRMDEGDLLDFPARLADYRRFSDPRYYKGVEYADVIESLARRRCAEIFATDAVPADDLYVNVQPLSGSPANTSVYHALLEPGETFLGMNLLHGGHLTHGSPVNRTGKLYNAVHYTVKPDTEQLDYEEIAELARQHKPRFILAGFTSYPWAADWEKFRQIADEVGAYLFADIAHVAGLVAAGAYPSPVGIADVITFTTHKSLCGPRGACILTNDAALARKIDRAVFPGEQGGPHVNVFAAMAVAFKIAQSAQFRQLQFQIIDNCIALTEALAARGFRIPYGGTNTHMANLDCKSVRGPDGEPLSGDIASRILDLVGIVVNRNTIPGDRSALNPSGLRFGTTWVTQRGFKNPEIQILADIIANTLNSVVPFRLGSNRRPQSRAKIEFETLNSARISVRDLAESAGIDFKPVRTRYPHFYYLDDGYQHYGQSTALTVSGDRAVAFLSFASTGDTDRLRPGENQPASFLSPRGEVATVVSCLSPESFRIEVSSDQAGLLATWLRDLSDGFVLFDEDVTRKLPGPVRVEEAAGSGKTIPQGTAGGSSKAYFIGIDSTDFDLPPLPEFRWEDQESAVRRTPLFDIHRNLGAKMIPFAGWEMPVWYSSVVEEHTAVRQAAGVFDVAHMGVYQAEGPQASLFLDSVCANDVSSLAVGESLYTQFLDADADVIDDLLVYRRGQERFLVVVNASNDDKDWAWLNEVRAGSALVDRDRPWARALGCQAVLRNLRDPREGDEMRVDLALQGPRSRDILLALGADSSTESRILKLGRTELCEGNVGGFDLIISRTGYTGEKMAFELFVHPDRSAELFQRLLEVGERFGVKPCGLGARDSLRTEAGLPLYGHEMGGELNLGVGEAGFGGYVKVYKPWFIGRAAYLAREAERSRQVVRFRFSEKGVRMAHLGDPVLDRRGRTLGVVTSCAVDKDGLLTGQAVLETKSSEPGTQILIYQSAGSAQVKNPADLKPGDRTSLPSPAEVLTRFPKA
ncbi:MAG TPA: glycine cleavage system aminomethyltransferase GcvT [Anaerolineales bacterium]|nr:glycine cleavage system aminomethyltransferase GcvT [Anaerolineales bacterium]